MGRTPRPSYLWLLMQLGRRPLFYDHHVPQGAITLPRRHAIESRDAACPLFAHVRRQISVSPQSAVIPMTSWECLWLMTHSAPSYPSLCRPRIHGARTALTFRGSTAEQPSTTRLIRLWEKICYQLFETIGRSPFSHLNQTNPNPNSYPTLT